MLQQKFIEYIRNCIRSIIGGGGVRVREAQCLEKAKIKNIAC
jgi:hypothetical protein